MKPYKVIKHTSVGTSVFTFEFADDVLEFFPLEKYTYLDVGQNTIKTEHEIIAMRNGRRVVPERLEVVFEHRLIYVEGK